MEHLNGAVRPEQDARIDAETTTVEQLLEQLGVATEPTLDEPPTWVTVPLSEEFKAGFARLIVKVAANGIATPGCLALPLIKLARQPGLPPQAPGFLAYAAAELFAAELLENERARHAAGGITLPQGELSVEDAIELMGVIEQAIVAETVAAEDEDQDAGVPHGAAA